jgi:hypothetical protein
MKTVAVRYFKLQSWTNEGSLNSAPFDRLCDFARALWADIPLAMRTPATSLQRAERQTAEKHRIKSEG